MWNEDIKYVKISEVPGVTSYKNYCFKPAVHVKWACTHMAKDYNKAKNMLIVEVIIQQASTVVKPGSNFKGSYFLVLETKLWTMNQLKPRHSLEII